MIAVKASSIIVFLSFVVAGWTKQFFREILISHGDLEARILFQK